MEMSGFRPELHVAQQSRRDKLRVHQTSSPPHHIDSGKLPLHPGLNPDIVQVRNVRNANLLYDPTMFSSEMANFSINANALSGQGSGESENFGNWRSLNPAQSLDWVTNYTSGSVGTGSNNQNHMFGREANNNMSPSAPHLKPSSFHGYQDVQSSLVNQSAEISSHHVSQKHLGTMHFSSPPLNYLNTLQDVVTSASTGGQDQLEMASFMQQRIMENELVLLPSYVNQSNTLRFDNASSNSWMDRQTVENRHNWTSGGMGFSAAKSVDEDMRNGMSNDSNQQGLFLSLSSNPPSNNKVPTAQFGSQDLRASSHDDLQSPKTGKSSAGYLCSITKPSVISKACGKSLQDIVGSSTSACRSTGPLGPFTGYATILKSSKFLKPAQQLLDEFCRTSDSKVTKTCEASERMPADVCASASVSVSTDAVNAIETEPVAKRNNSGASSSTFYGSNEISSGGGAASISSGSFGPEYQQKKAKLLCMQEEVCGRYKQYHQQMQMVVSSFESVAGLSSATPYISMALNTVSRHFRCLTNAIKDQLKRIRKALGEEYLSSAITTGTTGCSSSKEDKNLAKLKFMGLGFQKHNKSGGGAHLGFTEPQQHVWRPQRGLPERSVAILRAWLFEHFLHPYPTDTDKHMLATQTGLSRNQVIFSESQKWGLWFALTPDFSAAHILLLYICVEPIFALIKTDVTCLLERWSTHYEKSVLFTFRLGLMLRIFVSNWFINARVRVWKPMVEEIHMLETRGSVEASQDPTKKDGNSLTEGTSSRPDNEHQLGINNMMHDRQLECSGDAEQQYQEVKRSRIECQVPSSMDGGLMGFVPYQRSGLEVGGLGAVSLTLGLRHGVESGQQQQQQQLQQQEDQLRGQLGSQMIRDFVG